MFIVWQMADNEHCMLKMKAFEGRVVKVNLKCVKDGG